MSLRIQAQIIKIVSSILFQIEVFPAVFSVQIQQRCISTSNIKLIGFDSSSKLCKTVLRKQLSERRILVLLLIGQHFMKNLEYTAFISPQE